VVAAVMTTGSFLPQAHQGRYGPAEPGQFPLIMYSMFTTGVALWLAYEVRHQPAAQNNRQRDHACARRTIFIIKLRAVFAAARTGRAGRQVTAFRAPPASISMFPFCSGS